MTAETYECEFCGGEMRNKIEVTINPVSFSIGPLEIRWNRDRILCVECLEKEVRWMG